MKKRLSGFTIIEMVVVVAVIAIALPAIFAIMFAVVREQAKVYALKQVKREGDFALSTMQNTIRSYAQTVNNDKPPSSGNAICTGSNSSQNTLQIYFTPSNVPGGYFGYKLNGSAIASDSSILNQLNLTSPNVTIPRLQFGCSRTSIYSPPLINISFTVRYGSQLNFFENQASLDYSTQIKMKNY